MDKAATACKWARRMPAQSVYLKAEDIGCHREEGLKKLESRDRCVCTCVCECVCEHGCRSVWACVCACACTCLGVHLGPGERGKLKDKEGK